MNKDTLEELYRKYYIPAMRYVLSLCNNPEIAEDIVSDGFVKAFTVLDDKIPSFQYWLLRVLKNIWIDYLRKNKNITGESDSEPVSYITPEKSYLEEVREYINENGMYSYGCYITAPADVFIDLLDSGIASQVWPDDAYIDF